MQKFHSVVFVKKLKSAEQCGSEKNVLARGNNKHK
jgi:hypothetical protein